MGDRCVVMTDPELGGGFGKRRHETARGRRVGVAGSSRGGRRNDRPCRNHVFAIIMRRLLRPHLRHYRGVLGKV